MNTVRLQPPPFEFDGPYAGCYVDRVLAMDKRHVYMLFEILCCWPFASVLEIGCCNGASSVAFIEAQNLLGMHVTFCDPYRSQSFKRVLQCSIHGSMLITTAKSTEVLAGDETYDMIFIDANHDLESVKPELDLLVKRQPLCVVAHDTNATEAGIDHCEGAQLLRDTFRGMPGYFSYEDCVKRPHELTHRGLFVATRSAELFARARCAMQKWSH